MKNYLMSSYLTFRFIPDDSINLFEGLLHKNYKNTVKAKGCRNALELNDLIELVINEGFIPGKTAILLSGGIDSAVLASYLPTGTKAYTFKCIAENAIDETAQASIYAKKFGLDHEIIEMYWSDFLELTPALFEHNNIPMHSIEIQLYKAALHAKKSGIEKFIIGESADLIYGGMDKLLSKNWKFDEFLDRYTFVKPEEVLHDPVSMLGIYEKYRIGDNIDLLRFMNEIFSIESFTSYMHAFNCAKIDYVDPYAYSYMSGPLDLDRVRSGEPKYIVRELFKLKYPELGVPYKIPLPRAMDQWLKDWKPTRPEFIMGSESGKTGDQKWLMYCLEEFLNYSDN